MIITRSATPDDFESIYKLNYQTFVQEIPQHEANENEVLVDKHHHKNNYIVAYLNDQIVGMISYSTTRPFSLDAKIPLLDSYLPPFPQLAEIRLLAVIRKYRNGTVAYRLFKHLASELVQRQIYAAVISGTTKQLSLYYKIGFIPFGPLVGTDTATYQPMYITFKELRVDFKPN